MNTEGLKSKDNWCDISGAFGLAFVSVSFSFLIHNLAITTPSFFLVGKMTFYSLIIGERYSMITNVGISACKKPRPR